MQYQPLPNKPDQQSCLAKTRFSLGVCNNAIVVTWNEEITQHQASNNAQYAINNGMTHVKHKHVHRKNKKIATYFKPIQQKLIHEYSICVRLQFKKNCYNSYRIVTIHVFTQYLSSTNKFASLSRKKLSMDKFQSLHHQPIFDET